MTETPAKYIPCNGVNEAGLLHCPSRLDYDELAAAERSARRTGKTHVAVVVDGVTRSCEPVSVQS
jgi:hypothetical protein